MMDDGRQTTEGKWGREISVYNLLFSIYYFVVEVIDPRNVN